ncbi:hypothetical protein ACU6RU_10955 [Microbacterium sp. F1-18]
MRASLRRHRPVRFVFAPQHASSGTTIMRGAQLAAIAEGSRDLHERTVAFAPMTADFRQSDLFLTKGASRTAGPALLDRWRRNGNRIFFDPVDEAIPDEQIDDADTLVAASRSALAAYREHWPHLRVRLVNHHVDPRVTAAMRAAPRREHARIAYFGEPQNTVIPAGVASLIDVHPVDTSRSEQTWFSRLPPYAVHYAIRRSRALDHHKPFLKGFTAAACQANILVQRGQPEPELWLPSDYPFWVDAPASQDDIAAAVDLVRGAFGTAEWRYGLDVMRQIEDATSERAIRRALETLFAA